MKNDLLVELEVCELFLCESTKLNLRPNQLYRFIVDEKCTDCLKAAKIYKEFPFTEQTTEKS